MSKALQDEYELIRFTRDSQHTSRWNVTRFRSINGLRIQIGSSCAISNNEDFMADEYWCDTGPGQEFLWRDCPKIFQAFLVDILHGQDPDKRNSCSFAPD